eukprot:6460403-Amphidinium_carterae.1
MKDPFGTLELVVRIVVVVLWATCRTFLSPNITIDLECVTRATIIVIRAKTLNSLPHCDWVAFNVCRLPGLKVTERKVNECKTNQPANRTFSPNVWLKAARHERIRTEHFPLKFPCCQSGTPTPDPYHQSGLPNRILILLR